MDCPLLYYGLLVLHLYHPRNLRIKTRLDDLDRGNHRSPAHHGECGTQCSVSLGRFAFCVPGFAFGVSRLWVIVVVQSGESCRKRETQNAKRP